MPLVVGIDEAGYGPNLGPLVMTAVACRTSGNPTELWKVLRPAVRRHRDRDDGRLLIDDSKRVHAAGLHILELSVRAALDRPAESLADCIESLAPPSHAELRGEPWYTGKTPLPVEADAARCGEAATGFRTQSPVVGLSARCVIVCPERFNQILDRWDSKSAVLARGLGELVQFSLANGEGGGEPLRSPDEPVVFHIDKHGGRNFYGPMLQAMLTGGTVMAVHESNERSTYRILGLPGPVELTFEPRAESAHPCVALASMVSKYLREVLMQEFNSFWQGHLPGLAPTAGYPSDAGRFMDAIRPVAVHLGIAETRLWRRK